MLATEKDGLEGQRVDILVTHEGGPVMCPKCQADCTIADHAPERTWRRRDATRFETRLQELVVNTKLSYALRGDKIILDESGKTLIKGLIDTQFALGVAAKHFVPGQTASQIEDITAADLAARRIRGKGQAQIAVDGRLFGFIFNFGRTPIADA